MNPKDATRLFFRPTRAQKQKFAEAVKALGISQDVAGCGALEWWSDQTPLVQMMVIGKIPPDPEVIAVAVKQMGRGKRKG